MKKIALLLFLLCFCFMKASAQTLPKYSIEQIPNGTSDIEAFCIDGIPFMGDKKALAEKIGTDSLHDDRLALFDLKKDTTESYRSSCILLIRNEQGYWEKVCYLSATPSSARITPDNKVMFREPGHTVDSEFVRITFQTYKGDWLSQWSGP